MLDPKTDYLGLPKPTVANDLREDCPRIATALDKIDAHAQQTDEALDNKEARVSALEASAESLAGRTSTLEGRADGIDADAAVLAGRASALEVKADAQGAELAHLEEEKATREELSTAKATLREERDAAFSAHDTSLTAHDALVKRITVGSLSPVIGLVCVEDGGGSGLWFNCDVEGQPVTPPKSYWDYHPIYNGLRRVLVDNQVMVEHPKFYYRAFEILSGPFQGRRARVISPERLDGFKAYPSFMKNGQEIDRWYCGAFQGTNEGGTPVKVGSRPGKGPIVNLNFPTMKQYCANRNVGGVEGFRLWNAYHAGEIQLLALMEACTSDTQAAYGRGRVDTDSAANVDATDVSTAKWRGHVGLWGNVWQMVDGIDVATTGKLRLFKNDGTEEWADTGFICPAYDGTNVAYMQTFKTGAGEGFDFDDIFFPATTTTNAGLATVPDGFWGRNGSAGNVCYLGAVWSDGVRAGLCALNLHNAASNVSSAIGCRLAKV